MVVKGRRLTACVRPDLGAGFSKSNANHVIRSLGKAVCADTGIAEVTLQPGSEVHFSAGMCLPVAVSTAVNSVPPVDVGQAVPLAGVVSPRSA